MKWGHHVSDKQMRQERDAVRNKEYSRLSKTYRLKEREQEAYAYGKKHKLDLDDGGGGDHKTAGDTYMEKWEKIEQLTNDAEFEAGKKAGEYLINTYGQKRVDTLKRHNIEKGAAVLAVAYSIPIALLVRTFKNAPDHF